MNCELKVGVRAVHKPTRRVVKIVSGNDYVDNRTSNFWRFHATKKDGTLYKNEECCYGYDLEVIWEFPEVTKVPKEIVKPKRIRKRLAKEE